VTTESAANPVYEDIADYLELDRSDWMRIVDHYRAPFHIVDDFIRLRSEPLYREEFKSKWGEEPCVECFEDWRRQASDLDWLSWSKEAELAEESVYLRSIEKMDPDRAWNNLELRGDYLTLMRLNHQIAEFDDDDDAEAVINREQMNRYYGHGWDDEITDQDFERAARSDDPRMTHLLETVWNFMIEPESPIRWRGAGLKRHVLHTLHLPA